MAARQRRSAGSARRGTGESRFDAYLRNAQRFIESGKLDQAQQDIPEIVENLRQARRAVLSGKGEWVSLVEKGLERLSTKLMTGEILSWIESRPEDALEALRALWAEGDTAPGERMRTFIASASTSGGASVHPRPVSVLLMALDPAYAPFRGKSFDKAYR